MIAKWFNRFIKDDSCINRRDASISAENAGDSGQADGGGHWIVVDEMPDVGQLPLGVGRRLFGALDGAGSLWRWSANLFVTARPSFLLASRRAIPSRLASGATLELLVSFHVFDATLSAG